MVHIYLEAVEGAVALDEVVQVQELLVINLDLTSSHIHTTHPRVLTSRIDAELVSGSAPLKALDGMTIRSTRLRTARRARLLFEGLPSMI